MECFKGHRSESKSSAANDGVDKDIQIRQIEIPKNQGGSPSELGSLYQSSSRDYYQH